MYNQPSNERSILLLWSCHPLRDFCCRRTPMRRPLPMASWGARRPNFRLGGQDDQQDMWAGWWFGTFFFSHILGIIIPIDSYFSQGFNPPTSESFLGMKNVDVTWDLTMGINCGGFHKWVYPLKLTILLGFSIMNHPGIGGPHWGPPLMEMPM